MGWTSVRDDRRSRRGLPYRRPVVGRRHLAVDELADVLRGRRVLPAAAELEGPEIAQWLVAEPASCGSGQVAEIVLARRPDAHVVGADRVAAVPVVLELVLLRVRPLAAATGELLADAAGTCHVRRRRALRDAARPQVLDADLAVEDPVGAAVGLQAEVAARELPRGGRRIEDARRDLR